MAWLSLQTSADCSISSGLSAESEPAKAVWPWRKAVTAGAGAVGLVVDLGVRAGGAVVLDPDVHRVLLRAGAGGEELAALAALDIRGRGAGLVAAAGGVARLVRAAGRQRQGAGQGECTEGQGARPVLALKLHCRGFLPETVRVRGARGSLA